MPTHDKQNREYLRVADAKRKQSIIIDGDFTCLPGWSRVKLRGLKGHLFFECGDGSRHFIDGQLNHKGTHYVGIYPAKGFQRDKGVKPKAKSRAKKAETRVTHI